MNTLRTRLSGLLATMALLAIVAGLPLVLLALGASPIPHSLPSLETIKSALSSPDDGTLALGFIKIVAWAAWVFLTISIAAELISRVRGIPAPSLPGLRLPQSAAHGLASTAFLLFIAMRMSAQCELVASATPVPTAMAPAFASMPAPAGGQDQTTSTLTSGNFEAPATEKSTPKSTPKSAPTAETSPATVKHVVKRAETPW